MLGVLRNAAGTWVAKALLSLLVISFAAWGITTRMVGGVLAGHHAVITAGGTEVSINEYRLAYDRQISVMSQQFGQRITHEQAKALGIDDQVSFVLLRDEALGDDLEREDGETDQPDVNE